MRGGACGFKRHLESLSRDRKVLIKQQATVNLTSEEVMRFTHLQSGTTKSIRNYAIVVLRLQYQTILVQRFIEGTREVRQRSSPLPRCKLALQKGPSENMYYGEFDPGSGRTLAACLTH